MLGKILVKALLRSYIALYGGVKSELLVKFDTLMYSHILTRGWREVFPNIAGTKTSSRIFIYNVRF